MQRRAQSWWVPALVALLFLLLPALAVLQLRWIDTISEGETARLSNFVSTGVDRVAFDLERELAGISEAVRLRGDTREPWAAALARRLNQWRSTAVDPELVSRLLWIDPRTPETPRLLNSDTGTFSDLAWSDDMAAWSRAAVTLGSPRPASEPLHTPYDPPGLLFPVPGPAIAASDPPHFLLVVLDENRLRTHLLPLLVERHLGQPFGAPVEVSITLGERVLFETGSDRVSTLEPDAVARVDGGRLQMGSDGGGRRELVVTRGGDDRALGVLEVEEHVSDSEPTLDASFERVIVAPSWEIRATHAAGSVAAAVSVVRNRNLAMGLGILGILAVTAVLLALAARQSRRLAQQQMEFVAGVTHELRTPLTVIQSAAENLIDGVVDGPEQSRQYGRLIHDEGQRLSGLVERALVLAGAQNGASAPRPMPLNLVEFLPAAVHRCWTATRPTTAEPQLQMPDEIPAVLADPSSLEQALGNLLGNAVKYGGESPEVGITVSTADPRQVDITVWDRGPGIPTDEQERLFEPFFRGRHAREAQLPGSGLGLSVVRSTVDGMGGTVSIQSEPGAGSAFTLHLPAASP